MATSWHEMFSHFLEEQFLHPVIPFLQFQK